eukprot:scaffold21265_cov131-Isochrysis_galbana.AAC.15
MPGDGSYAPGSPTSLGIGSPCARCSGKRQGFRPIQAAAPRTLMAAQSTALSLGCTRAARAGEPAHLPRGRGLEDR